MEITILIADDNAAVRDEMRRILSWDRELRVIGEASSAAEAIQLSQTLSPDIVLLDIEMENTDAGIHASRAIHASNAETRIIILTIHDDERTVLAAFQTGVVDFLLKDQAAESLCEAVRLAMRDKSPLRPIVSEHLRSGIDQLHHREEQLLFTIKVVASLTASELSILRDIVQGKPRKQIARERFVEIVTIKKHVNGIHKKFGSTNTAAIVRQVQSLGIFDVIDELFSE